VRLRRSRTPAPPPFPSTSQLPPLPNAASLKSPPTRLSRKPLSSLFNVSAAAGAALVGPKKSRSVPRLAPCALPAYMTETVADAAVAAAGEAAACIQLICGDSVPTNLRMDCCSVPPSRPAVSARFLFPAAAGAPSGY
jgi:hypothetical protein